MAPARRLVTGEALTNVPSRRAVIHIGFPKTGSSTLQGELNRAQRGLGADGVVYPVTGRLRGAHHPLAWVLRRPDEPADAAPESRREYDPHVWRRVHDEADERSARVVVVSSEHFSLRLPAQIDRLAALVGDWDVRVVAFRRPQRDLIPSWWQEEIKAGGCEGLAQSLPRLMRDPLMLGDPVLDRWRVAFGADSVHDRPVPPDSDPEQVVFEFCELAEIRGGWWSRERVTAHNQSFAWEHVEALRAFNIAMMDRCRRRGTPYEQTQFVEQRRRLTTYLQSLGARLPKPTLSDRAWLAAESGERVHDEDVGSDQLDALEAGREQLERYLRSERRWRVRARRRAGQARRAARRLWRRHDAMLASDAEIF